MKAALTRMWLTCSTFAAKRELPTSHLRPQNEIIPAQCRFGFGRTAVGERRYAGAGSSPRRAFKRAGRPACPARRRSDPAARRKAIDAGATERQTAARLRQRALLPQDVRPCIT